VIEPNIIIPPSYQVTSLAHLDLLVVVVDVVELCRDGTVVGGGGESCYGHVLCSGLSKRSLFWAVGLGPAPRQYLFLICRRLRKGPDAIPPVKNLLVCGNDDEKRSESEGRSEERMGGAKQGAKGRSEIEERGAKAMSKSMSGAMSEGNG